MTFTRLVMAPHFPQSFACFSSAVFPCTHSLSSTKQYMKQMIEVERKFAIPKTIQRPLQRSTSMTEENSTNNPSIKLLQRQPLAELDTTASEFNLENKLLSLGFMQQERSIPFEDTYFDLGSPYWFLSTNDQWFRYRQYFLPGLNERHEENWQLKRPLRTLSKISPKNMDKQSSTVYEELEGVDALNEVLSLWNEYKKTISEEYQYKARSVVTDTVSALYTNRYSSLFHEPWKDLGLYLKPFAQFKTYRTTWVLNSSHWDRTYDNLTLDFDATDFGYTVGEAEILVEYQDEIPLAQSTISRFLELLLENCTPNVSEDDEKVLGKLEFYLKEHDFQHYQACIEAGTL